MSENATPNPAVMAGLAALAEQIREGQAGMEQAAQSVKEVADSTPTPVNVKVGPRVIPFQRSEHLMHHPFAGLKHKVEEAGIKLVDKNTGFARHQKREAKKAK